MMTSYGKIYTVDNVSFSFSDYKGGQKIRVWYDKILEFSTIITLNVVGFSI